MKKEPTWQFPQPNTPLCTSLKEISAASEPDTTVTMAISSALSPVQMDGGVFLSPNLSRFSLARPSRNAQTIIAMATQKKINKYDGKWKKQWFGAGLFYEGMEEVDVDVFKILEKKKVLSNVEKAGLLSKAEELGFTLSSLEKLGLFSKAEELGLLSLLEKTAGLSPSVLASAALPALIVALAVIVVVPDDSTALVVLQAVLGGAFGIGAIALLIGSVLLGDLQEAAD